MDARAHEVRVRRRGEEDEGGGEDEEDGRHGRAAPVELQGRCSTFVCFPTAAVAAAACISVEETGGAGESLLKRLAREATQLHERGRHNQDS